MTNESTLPGIHPTDDVLLFFGDVRSESDAAALIDELRRETPSFDATAFDDPSSFDRMSTDGSFRATSAAEHPSFDDPFAPGAVAESWDHLRSCTSCLARRDALCGAVASALLTEPLDAGRVVTSNAVDDRVNAALGAFVPNNAAAPESLARVTAPRRRWLRRSVGVPGSGTSTGAATSASSGGVLSRPWAVGVVAVALLASIGAAVALRPRATEQSAVGTVARAQERSTKDDQSAGSFTGGADETVVEFDSTAAAAETEAAAADAAMAEAAPSPVVTEAPPPASTVTNDGETGAAVPESARTEDLSPPLPNTRSRAAEAAPATTSPPAAAKAKRVPNPEPAVAAASPAMGLGQGGTPDLGTFLDIESAFDRFADQFPVSGAPPALSTPTGDEPTTTLFTNGAASAAAPTLDTLCPSVKSDVRAVARVATRSVVVVRITDANGRFDAIIDTATCAEVARRPVTVTAAANTVPPPTTPPPTTTLP